MYMPDRKTPSLFFRWMPIALALNACAIVSGAQVVGTAEPLINARQATLDSEDVVASRSEQPRLVVQIVVDQLRSDYLESFRPLFGQDGFLRLLREGLVCLQAEGASLHADRAAAVATVSTGAVPADHGITGLRWIDRQTLRPTYCTDDAEDETAPRHLLVSTLGDELKIATQGTALVYAVAAERDLSVLSAGHAADAALWIDDENGTWRTSTFYGAPPVWLKSYNDRYSLSALLDKPWEPASALAGNFQYFLSTGVKEPFSHKWGRETRYADLKTSALINEEIGRMAQACLTNTMLGVDNLPDLLAIGFYAGNYRHQAADEAPIELQDAYVRLDRTLASLLQTIDDKVGLDRTLIVLTSTGTPAEETQRPEAYRIPTGTFSMERATRLLNMYLAALHGPGQWVEASIGAQLYLNHALLEQKQLQLSATLGEAQDFLLKLEGVRDVYTSERLLQGAWTPGLSQIRAGYHPQTSGDILLDVSPGWRFQNEQTREQSLIRAAYIPFPIIFMGAGTRAQQYGQPLVTTCIAPTLAASMRIRAPNACAQRPIPLK